MQLQKTIFTNKDIELMLNFSGLKEGVISDDDFKLHFYALNKKTGTEAFSVELNVEQARGLYNHLCQISLIKDQIKTTSGKFIETTDEILEILNGLKDIDPEILEIILDKLNEDEKIKTILKSLSKIELKNLSAAHKQQNYQTEIKNLEQLLELEENGNIVEDIKKHKNLIMYKAGQPEKIFQNWIEQNLWVFGIEYIKKHDARKIAIFSEGDLLMESMDNFLDLIELKRPKLKYKIFNYDSSHKSYYPSSDLSEVIGQSLFYLQKMDDYKLNLEKEYNINILRPRIKIVLGRTDKSNEEEFKALRMLNSNLNHIQIVSYDYLLSCGKKIISLYGN